MRRLHPELERALRETLGRWRRLRWGEATAILVGALALAGLLLGLSVARGFVREPVLAVALAVLLVLVGGAAFLVILIACAAAPRSRAFLSEHVERVHVSLGDRLNTLVWIDSGNSRATPESYRDRIEGQACEAIATARATSPFSAKRLLALWAVSLALAVGTIVYLGHSKPWTHLAAEDVRELGARSEPNAKLPLPDDTTEVKKSWGEVRITEPGRDLKVTKVDVVPLQIEAASSDTLQQAQWLTALGAAAPSLHPLPKPREPHYAVYKPLLYVDELRLSDWDVVTYHASAKTTGGSYTSELYFIEVRPFREDILKTAGGEGSAGYAFLSELSSLIDRQKHAIRETHGFLERRYERLETRRQDRQALASAETDLAEAARHLYAQIAARAENQDVGVVLDNLALAEDELAAAGRALSSDDPSASGHERDALMALVATRKNLQKAIGEKGFGRGGDAGSDEAADESPVAELPDKLKQISEFRDEQKAARELLDRAVAEQRRVVDRSKGAPPDERAALARKEEALRRELSDFAGSHPQVFRRAEKLRVAADDALRKASEALAGPTPDATASPREALSSLDALRQAVRSSGADRQLAQLYELKDLLDGQAKRIRRFEEQPDTAKPEDLAGHAQKALQTTREMKRLVEDTPAGDAFSGALRDALGPVRQAERERKLDNLSRANGQGRGQVAREAREDLEGLSRAFEESQPSTVRAIRKRDALADGDDEALERGLRQLEGLVAESEAGRTHESEDKAKRRRDILLNLRQGVTGLYGRDERTRRLLLRLEEEISTADLKVDARKLRSLLEEIEQFRVERSDARLAKEAEGALRHVDASKLPPAYRDRIQKYFQRLSETSP